MYHLKKVFFCSLALFICGFFVAAQSAHAATNLIANPSLETANAAKTAPVNWTSVKTGTNNATFTYPTGGAQSGVRSVKITTTSFTNGDAKWYFDPVTITGGQVYYFTNYYKSTASTKTYAEFQDSSGVKTVQLLGTNAIKSIWTKNSYNITAPANAVKVTVYQVLASLGTLQTDNYSLVEIPGPIVTDNVPNASVEQVDPRNNLPLAWTTERTGTNSVTFSYAAGTGHTGNYGIKTTVNSYTNGTVRWYFTPQTITGGKCYTFTDWYKASIASQVAVVSYDAAGTATTTKLTDAPASTDWKQYSANICLPANAVKYTVNHTIAKVGNLTLDDFAFIQQIPKGTIIVKNVESGGTAALAYATTGTGYAGFTLNNGEQNSQTLAVGTYSVTQTPQENWTSDGGFCDNGNSPSSIILAENQTVTCTFTNTYTAPTAKLKIEMTTENSGKFDILLNGVTQATNINNGSTTATVAPGTHVVSVIASSGTNATDYKTVFGGDCDASGTVTLAKDDNKTCTIANTYSPVSITNLVPNPSLEESDATTSLPVSWTNGGWGNNTAVYTYDTTGHTGNRSARIDITSYTDGDAKWYFEPVTVTPGQRYLVTDWYKSDVATQVSVMFNLSDGTQSYPEIGFPVAASGWTQFSGLVTAPTNAVSMTVLHFINKKGYLSTDDYSVSVAPVPTGNPANGTLEIPSPADPGNYPDLWTHSKWGTNTASFAYLQNEGHSGTKSVQIEMTAYTDGDAKWYFDPPTPVAYGESYVFSDWYKSTVPTHVIIVFNNTDGTIKYAELRMAPASPSTWSNYSEIVQVPLNAKTMTVYHMINTIGTLATDDYSLLKTTPTGFNRPVISITFDDSWEANTSTAIPTLATYGFKSTYYFATTYVQDPTNGDLLGNTGPEAVQLIYNQGHEVGSHSITHPFLTKVDATTLNNELSQSKSYLEGLVGTGNIKSFATPYGDYNETVLSAIRNYYQSHRPTDEGYNLQNNFDVSRLKVQNMKKTTTLAEYQSWIDQAVKDKSWLVIVYHRVMTGTASDPLEDFDTPLANFTPQMNAIKAAVQNSGATVLPVSQAIAELSPQM